MDGSRIGKEKVADTCGRGLSDVSGVRFEVVNRIALKNLTIHP